MKANDCKKIDGCFTVVNNERGVALVLVLMMLMLLTILGVTMFTSSTSELKIAGNYRNNEEAFYAAEAALDYGVTFADIYTSIIPGSTTTWPQAGQGKLLDGSTLKVTTTANTENPNFNRLTIQRPNGASEQADVRVEFIASGNVPVGAGFQEDSGLGQGSGFRANSFDVDVIAYGPNNSHAEVDSQIARIVPQQ